MASNAIAQDYIQDEIGGVLGNTFPKSVYDGQYGSQSDGAYILSKNQLRLAIETYYTIYDNGVELNIMNTIIKEEDTEIEKEKSRLKAFEEKLTQESSKLDLQSQKSVDEFNEKIAILEENYGELQSKNNRLAESIGRYNELVEKVTNDIKVFSEEYLGKGYYLEDYLELKIKPELADAIVAYEMGRFVAKNKEGEN